MSWLLNPTLDFGEAGTATFGCGVGRAVGLDVGRWVVGLDFGEAGTATFGCGVGRAVGFLDVWAARFQWHLSVFARMGGWGGIEGRGREGRNRGKSNRTVRWNTEAWIERERKHDTGKHRGMHACILYTEIELTAADRETKKEPTENI